MWSKNLNHTLEESFEILEVFDFMSNFMLLHILKEPGTLVEWAIALGDEAAEVLTQDRDNTLLHNWMSLLHLQPYLSPFDILYTCREDEIDHGTLRYFTSLLAAEHDDNPSEMNEIENNVSDKLKQDYDVSSHAWELYRHHGWWYGVRDEIFSEDVSIKKIASDIIQFKNHGRKWWEFMAQASNVLPQAFQASVPNFYLMNLSAMVENIDDNGDIWFIITEENLLKVNG
ncbi:hypothetical protein EMCG_05415 [[Emmonsia] crescens]|uniref:Uncharacterized protein n=1 Tax=[Emmonsia] crescens TaxID=73230 RepID=A0A0G2HNY2_9EURO|nr:hypothetical protein EMCG_05415 [Emmonsia crescens UAMH 3008]